MPDLIVIASLAGVPQSVPGALSLFLALAIGHALADFPLQGAFLADAKNRHADLSQYFGKTPPPGVWVHALTAHSLVHAGAVWVVTGSALLGAIELVLHWVIDYAKCEGWTGFNTDQILHYLCKLGYALVIYAGVVGGP